jgi:hypothetical protein
MSLLTFTVGAMRNLGLGLRFLTSFEVTIMELGI